VAGRLHLAVLRLYGALPLWARKFAVRRLSPTFRVGAACIVVRDDGALLLIRHSYRKGWGLPGGLIRRGEEPDEAARRETSEEIGVDVDLDGERMVIIDVDGRRVDVVFPARISERSPNQTPEPQPPEVVEVRWFDSANLPRLQEEAAAALKATSRKQLQRRAGSSSDSGGVAG
jgi:8-oxo-dGTP pyrophosphatase MutT (NUDIX family)